MQFMAQLLSQEANGSWNLLDVQDKILSDKYLFSGL